MEKMSKLNIPWRLSRGMRKTLLYMRLTFVVLLVAILQTFAVQTYSQTTKLSINLKNAQVQSILHQIESQSEFYFLYSRSVVDVDRIVDVELKDARISEILDVLFDGTDIVYTVVERQIVLTKKADQAGFLELPGSQQAIKVSGKVVDSRGYSLPGVSVAIKGTTNGVITDADGNFTLQKVSGDATLVFSFIGMKTQEIAINGKTKINVSFIDESIGVDEVVVVGFGTQKKVNLTGAVSQITTKDFQDRPITRITQALQGVIPNLNVVFGSGKPGQSGTLNIRGNTSINGGSPLILIDGIPGNIDRINVNDVESITVLKDASASAIYGARAAFGVILITSKTPVKDKQTITYSNNLGWTTTSENTDFITSGYWSAKINDDAMYNALGNTNTRYTTEDYAELQARINDKTENPARPWVVAKPNASGVDMYRYYGNFDWYNYLFKKWRPKAEHTIGISGSSDKIRYVVTGTTAKEDGVWNINPDAYRRYNLRSKIEADVTNWLKISNSTRLFKSNYSWYGLKDNFSTVSNNLTPNAYYHFMAAYVPHNPDGSLTGYTGVNSYSIGQGMHAIIENGKSKGENSVSELESSFEATIKIMKGFTITGNYTYQQESLADYYRSVRVSYSKYPGVMEPFAIAALNTDQLAESAQNNRYSVINIFSNFDRSIRNHNIKAILGYNQELKTYKTISGTGTELLSETLNDLALVTGTNIVGGGASEWALRGVFYRFNYDYAGKYLIESSGRYDGTSRFSKNDRFGFFPSFSLGWRVSEEKFFTPLKDIVNNLKFRFSYGTLGNQSVATYGYISNMSTGKASYLVNNQQLNIVNIPAPVASSLTWEKTTTKNAGLDMDFLRNRLTFSLDAYIRDTKDMLTLGKTLPVVFGANEPKENAADLRTKGFELSIGWKDEFDLAGSALTYSFRAVLSDYTSKITKFDNPTKLLTNYYVGQQLGEIWGYTYDGYFKTTDEAQSYAATVNQDKINARRVQAPTAALKMLQAGDIKILDLDKSGVIDVGANTVDNPGDRRIIGNQQPRFPYGFNMSANWRRLGISVLFQGVGKQDWYPNLEAQPFWGPYSRPYGSFIPQNFQDKIWSAENPNAYFPRMIGYIAQNSELSVANNMYLQNLAYCRLKNLTIDYELPVKWLKKLRLDRCKIFVSGENILTWTKLDTDYIDPEEAMIDPTARSYPMGKTYSAGIELAF